MTVRRVRWSHEAQRVGPAPSKHTLDGLDELLSA